MSLSTVAERKLLALSLNQAKFHKNEIQSFKKVDKTEGKP
jgi:hypothetical protein